MHYQELHGDMPIHALQAFGGYLAMGDIGYDNAKTLLAKHNDNAAKALKEFLYGEGYNWARDALGDPTGFSGGLILIAESCKSFPKDKLAELKALLPAGWGQEYGRNASEAKKAEGMAIVAKAIKIAEDGCGGMSMTTKILIGLGIAGVVAGGYYMYHKKD